jgi:anti-sigma factor RsiW
MSWGEEMEEWVKCEQNEQIGMWMSLALDGLLDADGGHRLQQHLDSCPSCQLEWNAMHQVAALFERAPMVAPPLGFAVRVERRLAERVRKRHLAFGGAAVLTGSLSLAGVTAVVLLLVVVSVLAWQMFDSRLGLEQGTVAVSLIASSVGLVGKAASLFLGDLLLRYGPPLVLSLAIGLTLLIAIWAWLFVKRPGSSHHNGYA